MSKLTAKQQRFIDEYLVDLNATQAAIRAGYSEKAARVTAAKMLTNANIQTAIQKRQNELQNKLGVTQERVIQELAAIAFANGTDFAKVVGAGVAVAIPTEQLSPEKLPAIAGIKQTQDGVEIKLHNKVRALELLGKHLGMFTEKVEVNNSADEEKSKKLDAISDILKQMQEPKGADN